MAFERMANRYETQKDIVDRLHGTICRYKDVPVTVGFNKVTELFLTDLVSGELIAKIKPNDPDFDISSPEIGYFNYEGRNAKKPTVLYVIRLPFRKFRQGLYPQCCEFQGIDGDSPGIGGYGASYFNTPGFVNSVMGKFPDIEWALREGGEVAVSREVAFKKTDSGLTMVYFKTKNVGWIKPGQTSVEIQAGEFDWVIERYLNRLGLDVKEKVVGHDS